MTFTVLRVQVPPPTPFEMPKGPFGVPFLLSGIWVVASFYIPQSPSCTPATCLREVFPQNPGSPAAKDEWGQPTKAVHRNRLSALTTKCLLIGLPVCNAQHAQYFVAHRQPRTRLENPAFAALSLDFNALKWRSCWIGVVGSSRPLFRWHVSVQIISGGEWESDRSQACAVSGAFE